MTSHSECAKQIRKEIKDKFGKEFPNVKFSVKSSTFAGGNSVHVDWYNGPTYEAVNSIVRKYQYGSFNGMEDIYEYDNKV